MDPAAQTPALVWLTSAQLGLAREICALAGIRPEIAGSAERGQSRGVADALDCEPADDLRSAIAELAGTQRAELAIIMAPGEFGASPEDLRALRTAAQRRIRILTLEPIPASALEAAGMDEADAVAGDLVRLTPLPRTSAAWRQAGDVLEHFGAVRTMTVACFAEHRRGDGSLGAQLVAALDLLNSRMGEPESIDASYAFEAGPGTDPAAAPSSVLGETLRGLHGDLTANLRYSSGRTAAIAVSDQAGRFTRQATLLGEGGRLRVFDDGFEWIGPAGERIDQHRTATREDRAPRNFAAEAIAEDLKRAIEPGGVRSPAMSNAVLAMAQAALLSARTGQRESPETIRRMAGR